LAGPAAPGAGCRIGEDLDDLHVAERGPQTPKGRELLGVDLRLAAVRHPRVTPVSSLAIVGSTAMTESAVTRTTTARDTAPIPWRGCPLRARHQDRAVGADQT
jgi:hypothetical protein